ncbi:MAG: hypothetical protein ACFFDT_31115 [Candidatus Hodarchaeota archaeon]
MNKQKPREAIQLKGFFRVQIENGHDGKIVGDSGWIENLITNEGYDDYLCRLLAATDSSKQLGYMGIGTGTDPAAANTTLNGEIDTTGAERKSLTVSISQSKTVRFTATFGSTDSFLGGTSNIRNLGLFDNNSSNGVLFAGKSFASSQCDTNQNVNCTYDIQFS